MARIFVSKKKKIEAFLVIFILVLAILFIVYFSEDYLFLFNNPQGVRDFVKDYGVWAPLVFLLLHLVQIIISPIPGQVMGLASGYIFGWFLGTIYTMIGVILGSFIAIYLSRKFGRPFVERVIAKSSLDKADNLMKDKGLITIFLLFLLPAMPDDTICFLAGLTKIRIRILVFLAFIGRFPGFLVLNLVGDGIATSRIEFAIILFSVMMALSVIIYVFRKKLDSVFNKFLSRFN